MDDAYWHLALNHIPVIGTVVAVLQLTWSTLKNNVAVQRASYYIFIGAAIFALAAYLTGESAEHALEDLLPGAHDFIHPHEDWGKYALIASMITGIVASLALFKPETPIFRILTLALGSISLLLMMYTSNLGGQIRHSEIRPNATKAPETELSE